MSKDPTKFDALSTFRKITELNLEATFYNLGLIFFVVELDLMWRRICFWKAIEMSSGDADLSPIYLSLGAVLEERNRAEEAELTIGRR